MRPELVLGAAVSVLLVAIGVRAEPGPELAFVVDPKFGMESGVRSIASARLLFEWSAERMPPAFSLDERQVSERLLSIVGRGLRFAFLDLPLLEFEVGFTHEVFGHGARFREYGASASYVFKMPQPYRAILEPDDPDHFSAMTASKNVPHHLDYNLPATFGGVEAGYLAAHRIQRDVVRHHGRVPVHDLVVYAGSKLLYAPSFFDLDEGAYAASPNGAGDDVLNYAYGLADRYNHWRPEERASIRDRLRTAYFWNLADPMLIYGFYAVLVPLLGRGERVVFAPVPHLGRTALLPTTRFNLTPFGAEHALGLSVAQTPWILDTYVRLGSSGLSSYLGCGVHFDGVRVTDHLSFGIEADAWRQPQLLVAERNDYDREDAVGGGVGLLATAFVTDHIGLTGKLAAKSRGYLPGQPLDAGPYGYAGIAIRLPENASR